MAQNAGAMAQNAASMITQSARCHRRSTTPPRARQGSAVSGTPFVATPHGASAGLQPLQVPRAAMGHMTGARQPVPVQYGMVQTLPSVAMKEWFLAQTSRVQE